jgi:hypothetical protein
MNIHKNILEKSTIFKVNFNIFFASRPPVPRHPKRHEGIESCVNRNPIHGTILDPDVDELYNFIRNFAASWFAPVSD